VEIIAVVAAIIGMILLGALLIRRLNAQHDERIAAFRYSDALPGVGRRRAEPERRRSADGVTGPPDDTVHREDRGGAADGLAHHPAPEELRRSGTTMEPAESTPPEGRAEVRIVAASPEVARRVADVLRNCFASTEQRSYPADGEGGTRLHLTVDTTRVAGPARSWLAASRYSGDDRTRTDEI